MSDANPEDLLNEAKNQDRLNTEPTTAEGDDSEPVDLQAAIQGAYAAIDDGVKNENITVRDTNLAALFLGLEETGELAEIAADAEEELGRDGESVSQSRTLGLLARVGMQELAPEVMDTAEDAYTEYLVSSKDEF